MSKLQPDAQFGSAHSLEMLCTTFAQEWSAGRQPKIEDYLDRIAEPSRHVLLRELIAAELRLRKASGQSVKLFEYYQRFPYQTQSVDAAVRLLDRRVPTAPAAAVSPAIPDSCSPTDETLIRPAEAASPDELAGLVSEGPSGRGREPRQVGHFQLLEHLGEGRFGSVWKARDPKLDRIVAVKIPHDAGGTQRQIDLFLREARAAAQVRHPNIVSIYEVGREDDLVYMATEFIQGVNLKQYLDTHGPRSPAKAADFCAKVADALHCAHEAGVVHRDLKPSNIMVDVQGQPHVADFGLAKRRADLTMTVEGQVIGTPAYMSPEQAEGQARTADRRTDVYSLGVILFELLTGELPFRGDRQMLMLQKLREQAPSPRQLNSRLPRDLETICLKCLERDPAKRYATCGELAEDLQRFLTDRPIQARAIGRLERVWRWYARSAQATRLTAGTYSAFLAAALLLWLIIQWGVALVTAVPEESRAAGLALVGLSLFLVLPMFLAGLSALNGSARGLVAGAALLVLALVGLAGATFWQSAGALRLLLLQDGDAARQLPALSLLAVLFGLGLVSQGVALLQHWLRR